MLLTKVKKSQPETEQVELKVPAYFRSVWGMHAMICENGTIIKAWTDTVIAIRSTDRYYVEAVTEILEMRESSIDEFMQAYDAAIETIKSNIKAVAA